MYAKVHKNGNVTVYRDDLDCKYSEFDCKGKDAIDTYEELVTNIFYQDNMNNVDVSMLDGWGYYIFSYFNGCKIAYYIAPEDFVTYQKRGQLHLYAQLAAFVIDDPCIMDEIYG